MSATVARSGRKAPRQARARVTVEAILEGTSQVLVSHGYDHLTTTRVAHRAGVSVGTLYQYFEDKEALVRALWEREHGQVVAIIEESMARSEGTPVGKRIEAVLGAVLRGKAVNADMWTALSATMTQLDGTRHLARIQAANEAAVRAVLEAHAAEVDVNDLDLTVFVVVNAIEGVINAAVASRPQELGDAKLAAALSRMILRFVVKEAHSPADLG